MSSVKITPEKAKALANYLSEITMKTELEALACVTREGQRLAFKTVGYDVEPDLMSAISAAMLHVGETAVSRMGFGDLWEVIVTGAEISLFIIYGKIKKKIRMRLDDLMIFLSRNEGVIYI